jgi:hypothetical protein
MCLAFMTNFSFVIEYWKIWGALVWGLTMKDWNLNLGKIVVGVTHINQITKIILNGVSFSNWKVYHLQNW